MFMPIPTVPAKKREKKVKKKISFERIGGRQGGAGTTFSPRDFCLKIKLFFK